MKAILLQGYGNVDRLVYEDVPIPALAADEVLVKLLGTSVNPIDFKLRRGDMKSFMPLTFPAILGEDVAGRIMAVGKDVTSLQADALVMGFGHSTYAEYVTCKPEILALIPDGMDPIDAGVLPLVLTTGAQLIESGVQPQAGERILITGALGPVGRTAVHVAKQHGAYVVAGVRGKQRAEADGLGADEILAVDDEDAVKHVAQFDAIADAVGGDLIGRLLPRLKDGGRLATVVGRPKAAEEFSIVVVEVHAQPDAARLTKLAEDIARGEFAIPISKRLKLADIRQAQQIAEKGAGGKILLMP